MLKQNYTTLFLLLSLFLMIGCKNKENKSIVPQRIETAIEIGESHPQQALEILDSIQAEELNKKNFMLYQIANIKAKHNANIDIDEQETELISKSVEYFEKEKDIKNTALANYYTATAYKKSENIKLAFTYYLKAYPYSETEKDSLLMGKILYNCGSIYFDQQLRDSANIYLKKAIPFFLHYPQLQAQAYRLLGASFYLDKDYTNGLKYLDAGLALLDQSKNKLCVYLYNETYGAIYKRLEKYQESAEYLRKNLVGTTEKQQLRASLNLVDIYNLIQNQDSSDYYVQISTPLLNNLSIKDTEDNFLLLFGYRVLQDYYINKGDKNNIRKYFNLFTQKQAQINDENLAKFLITLDKKIHLEQVDEANSRYYNLWLYAIYINMCVLAIILIIKLIRIKRNKQKIIKTMLEFNQLKHLPDNIKSK